VSRAIRILLFSTLYPSAVRPAHGVFVETRLRELMRTGRIEVKVVAPVPWFPSTHPRFGEYAQFASTPRHETRHGVEVHHPRYVLPPKVGMNVAPWTLAMGAWPTIRRLQREGFDFDLMDAHYYYPDGVAAMLLSKWLRKPFVVTARGTDLNLIPQHDWPRKLILQTAEAANASIGVCQALMDTLRDLGASPDKLLTLRNGVDLARFTPHDRALARHRLGLRGDGAYMLSVGHLIERKGHHVAIETLPLLPDVSLLIAGAGPELKALNQLAHALGVSDRVRFVGLIPQDELPWWYSAADALALCSSREGWANVLLESMACGTPVLATNIWGTPEVVNCSEAGRLLVSRSPQALADAWKALQDHRPDRGATRCHAEQYSWQSTTNGQLKLFEQVVRQHAEAMR
jgi:teichuronic acid biosynthesis glycosyltransferase TuaC